MSHGGREVRIAHGGADVGVTQPLLDLGQGNAFDHGLGSEGMAHVVDTNAGKVCGLNTPPKGTFDDVSCEVISLLVTKHQLSFEVSVLL